MILFPAIDLIGGKVVRLERGDRSRCKVYSDDPVAVARSFAEQGASWVHVVDLSAAFGEDEDACAANSAAIEAICGVDGLSVDVGGGVRSLARIDELAGYGARRIALGTALVTEPGFAEVAAQGFGGLLVADIAARDGQVKVNGWRDGAGMALDDAVAQLSELGLSTWSIPISRATACRRASMWRRIAMLPRSRAFLSWLRAASLRSTTFARWLRWVRMLLRAPLPAVRSTKATLRWPRCWPPPEGRSSPCLPNA